MAVIDTQFHLPTDEEKGELHGYQQEIPDLWSERVAHSLDEKYPDEEHHIIPTITGREYENYDRLYTEALKDTTVRTPTTSVELQGVADTKIIGPYDSSFFEYETAHPDEEKQKYVRAVVEHTDEYGNAVLLDHPFSKDGGLLRGELRGSSIYRQICDAAEDLPIYTDHYGNAWMETFRERPWSDINVLGGDRFGLGDDHEPTGWRQVEPVLSFIAQHSDRVDDDYFDPDIETWDLEEDTGGAIRNVGCSDAKSTSLAGQGVSKNPEYGRIENLDDVIQFLDDTETQPVTEPIPARIMVRKLRAGIGI